MSATRASDGRLRAIAIVAAIAALGISLTAVVVVSARGGGGGEAATIHKRVAAADVEGLVTSLELVKREGKPAGVRVTDATVRVALGLAAEDLITHLNGRALARDVDVPAVLLSASSLDAIVIYAEVERGGAVRLLRWELDGELRASRIRRRDPDPVALGGGGGVMGGVVGGGTTGTFPTLPPDPPPDPALAGIVKIDDLSYEVPTSVRDAILANPMAFAKGARVVPAMKNGTPDGFKLYAIRPTSLFAAIGLQNGDTLQAINGFPLTSADAALELYTKLRDALALELEVVRRGKPVQIRIRLK